MVVNAAGTGHNAQLQGYDVSGKTGTAQVISLEGGKSAKGRTDKDLRDNGWFVFFAPRDNPQIAGVVFAEHALHGSNAAIIAKHVLETFFAKKEGRPLPPLTIKGIEGTSTPSDNPNSTPPTEPAAPVRVAQVAVGH
jgi:penicillin-binding protein 2